MEVILKEEIKGLGKYGERVEVKDGYARNFLLPRGKAVIFSLANARQMEAERQKRKNIERRELLQAKETAERIARVSCTIAVKVGEDDKLFGSVTNEDFANVYIKEGIEIKKRQVLLDNPIKTVGVYPVKIRLHPEVVVEVKVWVVKE